MTLETLEARMEELRTAKADIIQEMTELRAKIDAAWTERQRTSGLRQDVTVAGLSAGGKVGGVA